MKLLTVIPVYISNDLHLDFTRQTIDSLKTSHDNQILLVNNYCAPEFTDQFHALGEVLDSDKNIVSRAWNLGIREGRKRKVDYILVINNDLLFHPDALDNWVKFAQDHPEFVMWTAAEYPDLRTFKTHPYDNNFDEHPHFSAFMIKPEFPDILRKTEVRSQEPYPGYFDEAFSPAYFEDSDLHTRILRAGLKAGKTGSALFYHYGSRTIKTDHDLDVANGKSYETNRRYFQTKWGFDPHNQVLENDDPLRFKYHGPFEP